jgi:hypothetical protein
MLVGRVEGDMRKEQNAAEASLLWRMRRNTTSNLDCVVAPTRLGNTSVRLAFGGVVCFEEMYPSTQSALVCATTLRNGLARNGWIEVHSALAATAPGRSR